MGVGECTTLWRSRRTGNPVDMANHQVRMTLPVWAPETVAVCRSSTVGTATLPMRKVLNPTIRARVDDTPEPIAALVLRSRHVHVSRASRLGSGGSTTVLAGQLTVDRLVTDVA